MALQDILVCLDPTDAGEARLRLAAALAREHHAHLSATYILPETTTAAPLGRRVIPPTGLAWRPPPGTAGADPTPGADPADIIEQRFREAVRPHAAEGDWHLLGPDEGTELVALSTAVDLVVYGQASPDHHSRAGLRPEDIIVGSGRPVLVVPYAGKFSGLGQRVLVAWDGSREAARALHDALPLIGKAETATVITVRRGDGEVAHDASSLARIVRHLERHGIAARIEETPQGDLPIADLLLSRAADLGVDLLVAGAYHHSQFREALVGGVSRELLDHMTVPVLMAH